MRTPSAFKWSHYQENGAGAPFAIDSLSVSRVDVACYGHKLRLACDFVQHFFDTLGTDIMIADESMKVCRQTNYECRDKFRLYTFYDFFGTHRI